MNTRDGMKLAAAAIGTIITGRPPVHVSRKILPMRGNYPQAKSLIFTSRMVYDGAGRRLEELVVLAGSMPAGTTRFFFAGQLEVERAGKKIMVSIPNQYNPEPIPIPAKSLHEAFAKYDQILHAIAGDLQEKLDAAEAAEAKGEEEVRAGQQEPKEGGVQP